jgi:hypothetical protein
VKLRRFIYFRWKTAGANRIEHQVRRNPLLFLLPYKPALAAQIFRDITVCTCIGTAEIN